jgi:SAM-dependent methyltransferase
LICQPLTIIAKSTFDIGINMTLPSPYDINFQDMHRDFINNFILKAIDKLPFNAGELLEIGPSTVHPSFFHQKYKVSSYDINPDVPATYHGDITQVNPAIPNDAFDVVIISEVLEHTLDPFSAVQEVRRILKEGGYAIVTVPLNARIHGPVPDCWRFTEFGLQVLFKNYESIFFDKLDTPDRNLFPLHYGLLVQKKSSKAKIALNDLTFMPVS